MIVSLNLLESSNGKTFKKRLHRSGGRYIEQQLFTHQSAVLNRWDMSANDYKACCNFFNNPNASLMELTAKLGQACAARCPTGQHVLVMQDTSEVNYNDHNSRLKVNDPDLGVLSNNRAAAAKVPACCYMLVWQCVPTASYLLA